MTLIRDSVSKPWLLLVVAVGLTLAACSPAPQKAAPATTAQTASAPAAGLLPLPEFAPCTATSHPLLPAKWQSSALLQDFFLNMLWFGDFVYDESAAAFRFALADQYGANLDFLVTTDRKLYLLEGGGELPTSCTYLTGKSPFTVPSRDWLNDGAVCVGQAPILARDQQWWKSPSGPGANWFWFDTGSQLPFRSMYYADVKPTTPVPIYEHFTFNYFPSFHEVDSTNLGQIVEFCQSQQGKSSPVAAAEYAQPSIAPILARSGYPKTDAASIALAQKWIPGLSECSSPQDLPPAWPQQVQATVFLTAVSFPPNPFPSRVFYDFGKPAQNTTLYYNPPTQDEYAQVALLLGDTGYIAIQRQDGSFASCEQALPGPQVPNWNTVDGCECRAQIAPGTVLNPSAVPTKILWCPTDLSAKQVFWTWYSNLGTPVVFMQSNSSPTAGTGLNLADYTHWEPGSVAPEGTFDLPAICQGQPIVEVPKACHNCHLPVNSRTP